MADPFCLALVKAGPVGRDRAQVTVWPWAVPSTWLCPLEKLPVTSCKAAVFCFFAFPTTPCKELLGPVAASVPFLHVVSPAPNRV